MLDSRWASATVLLLASLSGRLSAQGPAPWHDPSPHTIQFVTADETVRLEVLDWGGSGRALVLLAGLGNTAHVFDDFAEKFTPEYHVYGITRRGFGSSSAPASGYSADQLGDDVLAVLDALRISKPVLVGHSIAGEQLSSVATRHPERVAGLIYLDAGYPYAYYDNSRGDLTIDANTLRKKLNELQTGQSPQNSRDLARELSQQDLPDFQRDLQELQNDLTRPSPQFPAPSAEENASFPAFRSWRARIVGVTYPEAEFRQIFESRSDGGVGERKTPSNVNAAILAGEQKYAAVQVPVLAIYGEPHDPGPYAKKSTSPAELAVAGTADVRSVEAQAKAFQSAVPSAHVVRLPNANHYIFLSNEADVLREMRAFLEGLHYFGSALRQSSYVLLSECGQGQKGPYSAFGQHSSPLICSVEHLNQNP